MMCGDHYPTWHGWLDTSNWLVRHASTWMQSSGCYQARVAFPWGFCIDLVASYVVLAP